MIIDSKSSGTSYLGDGDSNLELTERQEMWDSSTTLLRYWHDPVLDHIDYLSTECHENCYESRFAHLESQEQGNRRDLQTMTWHVWRIYWNWSQNKVLEFASDLSYTRYNCCCFQTFQMKQSMDMYLDSRQVDRDGNTKWLQRISDVSYADFGRMVGTTPFAYYIYIYMGVSKNRGTPKWMVYNL